MPDIGWMELLVIGVVALIVVGPKDLPIMFRRLGQYTGRIRAMARDFQRAMDEAADEAGVGDIKRDLATASKYANPKKMGMDALKETLDEIDPSKYEEGSETRKVAEEKAAFQKRQRELAEERRREREASTIAEKNAAVAASASETQAPAQTARPSPALAGDAGTASADPAATQAADATGGGDARDATLPPARTGTNDT